MSGIKNLFNKNGSSSSQTYNPQPSHLLVEPIYTNASQMNNEFLNHIKPLGWQNSQGVVVQPIQHYPLLHNSNNSGLSLPLSLSQQQQPYYQSRGLLNRGGPYRQIRLRTHNWGSRSENGWSGFNNYKYLPQNSSSWEPQSFLLSELRAQSQSQRGLAAPFNQDLFWNQWQQQRFQQQQGFLGSQRGFNNNIGGLNSGFNNNVGGLNSGFGGLNSGFNNGFNNNIGGLNNGFNNNIGGFNGLNSGVNGPQQFVQTIMKPAIVQETVRTDRMLQIQPILHRAVEQQVINHIERHITEAPAAPLGGTVRMAPVIQETVQTRVIEEIQPVVHRQVAIAQVERVEEHLAEHIVAPVQHTNRVVYEPLATGLNNSVGSTPLAAPISPVAAPITPLNNSANAIPLNSLNTVNSAPLTNTIPITKVVPTGTGVSPMLLEKQQQQAAFAQPITPQYGAAMM